MLPRDHSQPVSLTAKTQSKPLHHLSSSYCRCGTQLWSYPYDNRVSNIFLTGLAGILVFWPEYVTIKGNRIISRVCWCCSISPKKASWYTIWVSFSMIECCSAETDNGSEHYNISKIIKQSIRMYREHHSLHSLCKLLIDCKGYHSMQICNYKGLNMSCTKAKQQNPLMN